MNYRIYAEFLRNAFSLLRIESLRFENKISILLNGLRKEAITGGKMVLYTVGR